MSRVWVRCFVTVPLFFSICWAQSGEAAAERLVNEVSPQAVVTITRHPTGADMVGVTPLSPKFTVPALQAVCQRIGEQTGDPARGVQIVTNRMGTSDNLVFLKASFATSGLINRSNGEFNLQAVARALGAGADGLASFVVSLPGESPNSGTIRTYANTSAAIAGKFIQQPPTMEYRIRLFTNDPAKIIIPANLQSVTKPKVPEPASTKRTNWPLFAIIGMCSVGVGLLVYCRLLATSKPRTR